MENGPRDAARSEGRTTAVIQAGLALLVAGSLVAFSFVAFRTGFAEGDREGVAAVTPEGGHRGPLVLPSGADRAARDAGISEEETTVASDTTEAQAVAGIRVRADRPAGDSDTSKGDRGDFDPIRKPAVAREEEDDEDDDHGEDDSWSADRSGKSASRGHSGSRASRNHSRGTRNHKASKHHSHASRGHSRG